MRWRTRLALLLTIVAAASPGLKSQEGGRSPQRSKFFAPPTQSG